MARELMALEVYDEPAGDGTFASIYDDSGWVRNFADSAEAVGWLEENGYTIAYPEQEGDWHDPVFRLMACENMHAVYEREER